MNIEKLVVRTVMHTTIRHYLMILLTILRNTIRASKLFVRVNKIKEWG